MTKAWFRYSKSQLVYPIEMGDSAENRKWLEWRFGMSIVCPCVIFHSCFPLAADWCPFWKFQYSLSIRPRESWVWLLLSYNCVCACLCYAYGGPCPCPWSSQSLVWSTYISARVSLTKLSIVTQNPLERSHCQSVIESGTEWSLWGRTILLTAS